MKKVDILILSSLSICYCSVQQNDWAFVEKVFGKKEAVRDDVFKTSNPRTDITVIHNHLNNENPNVIKYVHSNSKKRNNHEI